MRVVNEMIVVRFTHPTELLGGGVGQDGRTLRPRNPHLTVGQPDHKFVVRGFDAGGGDNFSCPHGLDLQNGGSIPRTKSTVGIG